MHPIAFENGPFSIHWYGVMVALGFLAGLWTAGRRALRAGIAAEKMIDLGPWLIIGAIAGAQPRSQRINIGIVKCVVEKSRFRPTRRSAAMNDTNTTTTR